MGNVTQTLQARKEDARSSKLRSYTIRLGTDPQRSCVGAREMLKEVFTYIHLDHFDTSALKRTKLWRRQER
jgi:hypothetical protein